MLRRTLALLLVAALVLGWTSAIAATSCGAPTGASSSSLAALPGGCGTCENEENKGQPQGCAVLACTAGCVSGPATAADVAPRLRRMTATEKAAPAPHDALLARAIRPDLPPPR